MIKRDRSFCSHCPQALVCDCSGPLQAGDETACLLSKLKIVAAAASYVGIGNHLLLTLLQAGVPLSDILDIIQSRLEWEEQRLQQ